MPAIRRILASRIDRGLRLDPVLVDDAIDDALLRLDRFAATRDVDRGRAVGLLTTMTTRAALDRWRPRERREQTEQVVADVPDRQSDSTTEDVVMGMLEREASIETVLLGLRKAMELGRADLVRLVRTWLDLADKMSGIPTQRQVAEELKVSHTTVRRALQEFARLLDEAEEIP